MKHISLSDPVIGEEEINAVTDILRTTWLCQGLKVAEFERKLAELLDMPNVVCVSSCTAALHLSLLWTQRHHRRGYPRHEVIVPDFTFPATANAVYHAGTQPVFVDVDPVTYTLDPEKIEEARTLSTCAILPVHLFGQPANMLPIMEIAEDHKLAVIEDCAGALLSKYEEEPVGKFGLAGCFSFTPRKLITTGEGGAITTSDDKMAEWLRLMRSHGRKDVESVHNLSFPEIGLNYRMTDFQAALGIAQLNHANEFVMKRNFLADIYRKNLPTHVIPPREAPYNSWHTYTTFTVLLDKYCKPKRDVIDGLAKHGVQAHYSSVALHLEPALSQYAYGKQLPVTEHLSQHTIALPLHVNMTQEDVIYVCDCLKRVAT